MLGSDVRLQFRGEVFNVANHANFGLPVADLNSVNFGRIFSAAPPRLMQFGLEADFLARDRRTMTEPGDTRGWRVAAASGSSASSSASRRSSSTPSASS